MLLPPLEDHVVGSALIFTFVDSSEDGGFAHLQLIFLHCLQIAYSIVWVCSESFGTVQQTLRPEEYSSRNHHHASWSARTTSTFHISEVLRTQRGYCFLYDTDTFTYIHAILLNNEECRRLQKSEGLYRK